MTKEHTTGKATRAGNIRTAAVFASIAVGMLGMAYASVPLYRIFCQVTGYGGTTQVAEQPTGKVISQKITVAFDANVNRGMAWRFKPVQHSQTMRLGEEALAHYKATNTSKRTITGTATFNVSPPAAGQYFNKIECFCFTEQTLEPGQSVDMPVSYYVDPEIVNDENLKNLKTITLSYTFFEKDRGGADKVSQNGADGTATVAVATKQN